MKTLSWILVLISLGLFCFPLRSQENELTITKISSEFYNQENDSILYSLCYRLSLDPISDFAFISLQKKNPQTGFFTDISDIATGDLGEIQAGSDYMITWVEPNTGEDNNVKLSANLNPEVEVISQLVSQVDSTRMREDLMLIQGIRHRTTGLAQLQATQTLIRNRFAEYGIQLREDTFAFNSTYKGINLIGSQLGCGQNDKVWFVGGHYDTVDDSPGADDNGSAIVGMLEAARVLSQMQFEKRISYVAWDLEEEGLLGSIDFVENLDEAYGDIEGYLNFEMIGYYSDRPNSQEFPVGFGQLFPAQEQAVADDDYRGNFITNVGNTQNSLELMNLYSAYAESYVPELRVISVAAPGTGAVVPDLRRSDHTPFWLADIPALMLTDGANFRNANYHGPEDVLDSLNFTFMSRVVQATVATIANEAKPTICLTDETTITSLPNSIRNSVVQNSFKIYPNPAKDMISFDFSMQVSIDEILDYSIYNTSGAKVQSGAFKPNQSLEISNLAEGTFFIVIDSGKASHLGSFVIQK